MVLVFRFEQLFINTNEIMRGQLWQLISGQRADYAPILFFQMKLPSIWRLHTILIKIPTAAKSAGTVQSWLKNHRFYGKNRKFPNFRIFFSGPLLVPIETYQS